MSLKGSTSVGNVTIGDHTHSSSTIGKLTASIEGNTIVPYVGLGYDSAHFSASPFSLSLDFGALYLGKPKTNRSTEKSVADLDGDLRKEEASIDKKVSAFCFYPVVQLAAKCRF